MKRKIKNLGTGNKFQSLVTWHETKIDELVLYHRRGHLAIFYRPCVGGEERSDP